MSNAMRFGKRTLAGVAAGALALGALTIASAPAVSAAPKVTPKATNSLSATTAGPVRVTFAGTTWESVPYSIIQWTSSGTLDANDTVVVRLTSAPSPTAQLGFVSGTSIGTAATYTTTAPARFSNATDTAVLGTPTLSSSDIDPFVSSTGISATTGQIGVAANEAGTYAGTITVGNVGGNVDVVSFSFTTTGKPTTMTLAPSTQTVAESGTATFAATLKDAAGNTTQPLVVDSVNLTSTGGTLKDALGATGATITSLASTATYATPESRETNIWDGTGAFALVAPATAGNYTVSASPAGTLSSSGVTAQSATVVVSGSIQTTAVTNLSVSVPAVAYTTGTLAASNRVSQVPSGTSAITVKVTSVANANKTVRFAITPGAGTINGSSSTQYVNVAIDSLGSGTFSYTVGGAGLATGVSSTVQQVQADNSGISLTTLTVTQAAAAVPTNGSTITIDPSGAITTKLGSTVPVSVLVQTQFGEVVSGVQVNAYRGSTVASGTLVSSATTSTKGIASLILSGATGITAGTVENYSFRVAYTSNVDLNNEVQVTYSGTGEVTALTVAVGGGGTGITTPITNTTTSIPVIPNVVVPYTGELNDTVSSATYTVATGAATTLTTATGQYAQFTPTPTPGNPVTVTVPEGLKVCTAVEFALGNEWNGCAQTATVASGSNVYVFGTKLGTADVTFQSGTITATAKVRVSNITEAAYNVNLTPAKQDLDEGDFSKVTVKVTDVFGNGVSNNANAAYGVTLTATGPVLLAGQTQSTTLTSYSAAGTDITVLSSSGMAGIATLKLAPSSAAVADANGAPTTRPWSAAGYIKPTAAAAPVKEATAEVLVRAGAQKTISISGGRTTVSGKPGIEVVGFADGFANGDKVKPWIRFPGQTEYTAGSARPEVKDEEFNWSRKTGKKSYVYFTSDDDAILSNRIIIAAK